MSPIPSVSDGTLPPPCGLFIRVSFFFSASTAFLATHATFLYWVNFVLNDPFNTGLFNTLDARAILPADKCVDFDTTAFVHNLLTFVIVWWGPHSVLAREKVKRFIGSWGSVYDRPVFAFIAPLAWLYTLVSWQPVSNCSRLDVWTLPAWRLALHGGVFALASFLVLGLFYLLPNHVFGTDRCMWANGKAPNQNHDIITTFPYGLVRHPAAASFVWFYIGFVPGWNVNHAVLASFWTVFIVAGTLVFEEGGLRGPHEFGKKYDVYSRYVNPFIPSIWSLKKFVGLQVEDISELHKSK